MVQLSKTGEVGEFLNVDQFQPAKSQFECGFFSGAIIRAMGQPGKQPTQSVPQVIAEAESWYAQDNGNNSISNTNGMTLQEEYDLITQKMGMHYQAVALDVPTIRGWVRAGYPIMLTISETSVFDMQLGRNPYPWNPAGTHIFVVSGIASDGNFLVRDPANCTNLYDPNSLRPGPRHYLASSLQIWTATVVVPSWMPRPTSPNPPQGGSMTIPNGWHDDGHTLTAPNGVKVRDGFRDFILNNNWDPTDLPLREEYAVDLVLIHNTSVGPGSRLLCQKSFLWYTSKMGVHKEPFVAWELDSAYALITQLQQEIATLKATPAPAPQPTINISDLGAQLQAIASAAGSIAAATAQAQKDLQP